MYSRITWLLQKQLIEFYKTVNMQLGHIGGNLNQAMHHEPADNSWLHDVRKYILNPIEIAG